MPTTLCLPYTILTILRFHSLMSKSRATAQIMINVRNREYPGATFLRTFPLKHEIIDSNTLQITYERTQVYIWGPENQNEQYFRFRIPRGLPLGRRGLSPVYFCSKIEGLPSTNSKASETFSSIISANLDWGKSHRQIIDFSRGLAAPDENMHKNHKKNHNNSKFHRLIRLNTESFSSIPSAGIDWGRAHRQIINFSRGLGVPGEKLYFQHPEPQKNHISRLLSNFSTRASTGISTDHSKARKIACSQKSLLLLTQLHRSRTDDPPINRNSKLVRINFNPNFQTAFSDVFYNK